MDLFQLALYYIQLSVGNFFQGLTASELTFTFFVIVRPSVCRLSVTFVHPTQVIEIFGNVSTP